MTSDADNQTDKQTDAASPAEQMNSAPEKASRKKLATLEERLLSLDAKASKKALHDSRVLKRLGIVFIVLGACALLFEPLLLFRAHLPGYADCGFYFRKAMRDWSVLLLLVIAGAPAFGFTLRHNRSTAAQWLFRIVALLTIVESTLDMIDAVRQSNWGGFIGELVSVLISIRLCIITYNSVLFGPDPPSHNQLGYVRSKWKAGEKPEHIPEHVHKPSKYTKPCFLLALLLIPVSAFLTYRNIMKQIDYTKAQEYFEAGQTSFTEAGQAADPQIAKEKYEKAYRLFRRAQIDPKIRDVHRYLGHCAARGLGRERNYYEAFREFTRFPDLTDSDPDAQYQLALFYFHGFGTKQDIEKAAGLLQAAARKGQLNAKVFLGYDMTDEATASEEPVYGGQTVVEYLREKSEKQKAAGKNSFEDDIKTVLPPPPANQPAPLGPGRPDGSRPNGPRRGGRPQAGGMPAVPPGSAPAAQAEPGENGSDGAAPAAVPADQQ